MRNARPGSLLYYGHKVFEYLLARPSEEGGRAITYAAIAGVLEDPKEKLFHGQFVSTCEITEVSEFCLSDEGQNVQEAVWVRFNCVWGGVYVDLQTHTKKVETIDILSTIDDRIPSIVSLYLESS